MFYIYIAYNDLHQTVNQLELHVQICLYVIPTVYKRALKFFRGN